MHDQPASVTLKPERAALHASQLQTQSAEAYYIVFCHQAGIQQGRSGVMSHTSGRMSEVTAVLYAR